MDRKKIYIAVVVGLVTVVVLAWLFIESIKPLPGTKTEDLGREHVAVGTNVEYNSNPPTSGPHYEEWTKPGAYDEVQDDRNMVHSLEHGYVIISYNCDHKEVAGFRLQVAEVYAHEEGEAPVFSGEQTASPAAKLSENFQSDQCKSLRAKLTEILNKKGGRKLIVVPRPNLETRIALTAWNYLDKFDKLDISRIEKFIDAHLDNGPEKTME